MGNPLSKILISRVATDNQSAQCDVVEGRCTAGVCVCDDVLMSFFLAATLETFCIFKIAAR